MSEYQYYEFQAIDQPLNAKQMAELRAISTRADITPRHFVNEYNWGNLKARPEVLLERYFDAFLYVANWGVRRLMFRFPAGALDLEEVEQYCRCEWASVRATGRGVLLELLSDDEEAGGWEDGEGWLDGLLPLREDITAGDLRALYLGWLLCVQAGDLEDEEVEPPVPPGLGSLSAPPEQLADFLRIDPALIEVAAERSPALRPPAATEAGLAAWIAGLPAPEKDRYLLILAIGEGRQAGAELLRRFRRETAPALPADATTPSGRTVAELVSAAEARAAAKRQAEQERQAREEARRRQAEAEARARYLDDLATRQDEAWLRIEALIEQKQGRTYDEAVRLLQDLREIAERSGAGGLFRLRIGALREQHARKPGLMLRLDQARL